MVGSRFARYVFKYFRNFESAERKFNFRWSLRGGNVKMPKKFNIFLLMIYVCSSAAGSNLEPEFTDPLLNITIPVFRDVTFTCLVHHLGGYRIGWVKADTKAIQAIHDHVITHNPRISVSHVDHSTWNLHIRHVQEEDGGQYMCQINTDPMKSQLGILNVVVPPDFVAEETSGDTEVPEGGSVKLKCKARARPNAHIHWKRETGENIVFRDPLSPKTTAMRIYQGSVLRLAKVTRSDMGAYLCIASNGIPPSVSKRIMLLVRFRPVIHVPNQLLGAPLGTDLLLECNIEASPNSINYWVKDTSMVVQSYNHDIKAKTVSIFEVKLTLLLRNLRKSDVGTYICISKNSLGEAQSSIRVYDISGPTKVSSRKAYEEYLLIGSAEKHAGKSGARGKVVIGRTGSSRYNSVEDNHVPVDSGSNSNKKLKIALLCKIIFAFIAFWLIMYLDEAW